MVIISSVQSTWVVDNRTTVELVDFDTEENDRSVILRRNLSPMATLPRLELQRSLMQT